VQNRSQEWYMVFQILGLACVHRCLPIRKGPESHEDNEGSITMSDFEAQAQQVD